MRRVSDATGLVAAIESCGRASTRRRKRDEAKECAALVLYYRRTGDKTVKWDSLVR